MKSLSDTFIHDQWWESNLGPLDLESIILTTHSCTPVHCSYFWFDVSEHNILVHIPSCLIHCILNSQVVSLPSQSVIPQLLCSDQHLGRSRCIHCKSSMNCTLQLFFNHCM